MRPARVQVPKDELQHGNDRQQPGTTYNIWFNKWAGGDKDPSLNNFRSPYRCNIERDSGYTKADKIKGSYFCVYFARGTCYKGEKCDYLHRLPTERDVYAPSVDLFGRDKFANYRDDMGGVGSFLRENRTLFVGHFKDSRDLSSQIRKQFTEWGKVESIRRLDGRGIYFVTFGEEISAQFAKEAMAHQTVTGKETLNVKWAAPNPNPKIAEREQSRQEAKAAAAVKRILDAEAEAETETSEAKRKAQETRDTPVKKLEFISAEASKKLKASLVDYSDSESESESEPKPEPAPEPEPE